MMKKLILFLITIGLFFIESVMLTNLTWNGAALPLTLVFGLAVAVVSDEWDAIFMAILTGFLADLYTNHLFGINMLLNLHVFLALHFGKNYLRQEKNVLMAVVMGAAAFLRYGLLFGLNSLTGLKGNFGRVPVLGMMVLAASIPMLILTRRLFKKHAKRNRLI